MCGAAVTESKMCSKLNACSIDVPIPLKLYFTARAPLMAVGHQNCLEKKICASWYWIICCVEFTISDVQILRVRIKVWQLCFHIFNHSSITGLSTSNFKFSPCEICIAVLSNIPLIN